MPHLTRSSLHRLFQRHEISRLPAIEGETGRKKAFKRYPIGYLHIDIAEVRTEEGKLHLFVAIDRTSKFAFAQLHEKANRHTATAFLKALIAVVPYKIHTILTDNGIQFCDLPKNRSGPTARWQTHMFDLLCRARGIEHRLTKPNHPWTNGQVERMNRTLKEATVRRLQVLYSITKHAMRRSADEIGATSISFRPKVFSDATSVVDEIFSAHKVLHDKNHKNQPRSRRLRARTCSPSRGMMNAQRNRGMYLRVGERLAEIRKSRKISQAKLAKLLGVVEGTIQNYEHGRNEPNITHLWTRRGAGSPVCNTFAGV